ncbi:hypothetical protein ACP70R_048471 [Stipagrostis hirtigluma subsp. patula]
MRGERRRPAPPAADATAVLDDAHLAEILLRLPSAATLARTAALVCRRWRRVASSPAFLRRFRRLHPPPLLGFFVCRGGRPYRHRHFGDPLPGEPRDEGPLPALDPTFLPVAAPPPGAAGAVRRCGEFSLSSLPSVDHWALADARDGLLLLCSSCDRSTDGGDNLELRRIPQHFAVCNPLSGRSVLLPQRDAGMYIGYDYLGATLVITGDNDEGDFFSFEVLMATYFDKGPLLCAFSSSSQQWAVFPCPATEKLYDYRMPWIDDGARAGGCVYWVVHDWEMEFQHLLVLDTRTKKFSTMNLPASDMCDKYDRNVKVVRSEDDGDLRVVALARPKCELHFWRRDWSRSAKGRWLKEDVVKFMKADGILHFLEGRNGCPFFGAMGLRMIGVGEGFVFFKHNDTPWVYVLNLKEMKLQKLPNREMYSGYVLPYRMALSPPLPNLDQEGSH